ncbi:MAG: hypothetical protein Q8P82_00565 [bacterium]|nr:hypothetical protein [bacterium]
MSTSNTGRTGRRIIVTSAAAPAAPQRRRPSEREKRDARTAATVSSMLAARRAPRLQPATVGDLLGFDPGLIEVKPQEEQQPPAAAHA